MSALPSVQPSPWQKRRRVISVPANRQELVIGRPTSDSTSRISAKRCTMIFMRAVAEIEAEHIGAGIEQRADHRFSR